MTSLALPRPRSRAVAAMWAVLAIQAIAMVCLTFVEHRFVTGGHADLATDAGTRILVASLMAISDAVAYAVIRSQPGHPVGWLFLGLAGVLLLTGVIDDYAAWTHFFRPGSLPGTQLSGIASDSDWIPWFVVVAWILFLTPTGTHLTPRWGVVARVTAWAGAVCFVSAFFSRHDTSPPYQDTDSPLSHTPLAVPLVWVGYTSAIVMGLGLIAAAVSVIVRFRRARGEARLRLLWLTVALVPVPLLVVAAYVGSYLDSDAMTAVASFGFIALVPIGAGLSITRYRLYDVERILTATATYTLLTLVLVGTYAFIVWSGASLATRWDASPTATATIGALVAAGLAAPLRSGIQHTLDRRFNRRSYDARRVVRAGLAEEDAGIDLERLLQRALDDPGVTVTYPGSGGWVTGTGAEPPARAAQVEVARHGRIVARIGYDPARVDHATVRDAAELARPELDNGRLRAELGRRVEELSASRRRLATAQRRERRRIERDLHDGAQQSLLALAFDLQSAQVNGDPDRMRQALAEGTLAARDAVRELRALANGLHPAALADGGLGAALEEMARHSPVPLRAEVDVPERLAPAIEFTAWFVICEAVVNAQKHSRATRIDVRVRRDGDRLRLGVADDGTGGVAPDGPGLRGMRDRVDVARGTLRIGSDARGTSIEAELPCGS